MDTIVIDRHRKAFGELVHDIPDKPRAPLLAPVHRRRPCGPQRPLYALGGASGIDAARPLSPSASREP